MTSWKLFAFSSALFAGLTAVLAKIGVENIPSNVATLIRTTIVFLFLAGWVWFRKEWSVSLTLPPRSLIFLVLSGLATAASWMCYYRAIQLGPASLVSAVDKLSLVAAILLSVLFLGEKLTLAQWIGSGLITSGLLLIVLR